MAKNVNIESKFIAKDMLMTKWNNIQHPDKRKDFPKKAEFPTLQQFALDIVSQNFEKYPQLNGISEQVREKIIAKTSKSLDIKHTAMHIHEESYWKDACQKRWKLNNLEAHGCSWKQTYLEKTIEEKIKNMKATSDPEEVSDLYVNLKAAKHYVFNIRIPGMNYPIDFKMLMDSLPVLNNLSVTFGPLNMGMNYNRQAFGMKMSDAYKLAKGVETSLNLISLSLPGNLIDDDIMKILMNGFSFNRTLIELNLSHNRIGNQGARRIAKFIMRNDVLLNLDLSDNQIGYDGSRFLAQALKMNKNLQRLSLKLNNIKDKGGSKFFKDLMENESLMELNMAANTLGPITAEKMADYLADLKCRMQILDVSSNHMTDAAYAIIKAALTKNTSLREFNVKLNDMPVAHETELNEIVVKHHLDTKKIPFISKTLYERKRADSTEEIASQAGEEEGKNQVDSPSSNKSPMGKSGSTRNVKENKGNLSAKKP